VHRDPKSPLAVEARIRLARQEASRQEWEKSRAYLDDAIALGCPAGWSAHARLARGQTLVALNLPHDAHDDLVLALQYSRDDLELETAVRIELSEVLVQLQQWDAVLEHWEFLAQRAQGLDNPTPPWLATMWLHQAELQALKNDWPGAEQIVSRIHEQFPECDRRDEVDYVRARCFISKAQFDQARQLLHAIASNPQASSPELTARSWWMMGETYLMQRRYAEAMQAYEQVLGTKGSQYWHSAAWMQIGQCFELLRDVSGARNAYSQILERDAQGAFSTSASDRIAALPEQTPNAQIQPSARTSNDAPGSNKR
jgi:tetratricopeptide (TPR) repeat protein